MSNPQCVLTTTGFILPLSSFIDKLKTEDVEDPSIFKRTAMVSGDSQIADYVKNNDIYHSDIANRAYRSYMSDKSFENYIQLVDIATDILSSINYGVFFEIQANNRNLSPISFMLTMDLFKETFKEKYMQYEVVPLSSRFVATTDTSNDAINKNNVTLCKYKHYSNKTWENFISELAADKNAFSAFFKYVFVDTY